MIWEAQKTARKFFRDILDDEESVWVSTDAELFVVNDGVDNPLEEMSFVGEEDEPEMPFHLTQEVHDKISGDVMFVFLNKENGKTTVLRIGTGGTAHLHQFIASPTSGAANDTGSMKNVSTEYKDGGLCRFWDHGTLQQVMFQPSLGELKEQGLAEMLTAPIIAAL